MRRIAGLAIAGLLVLTGCSEEAAPAASGTPGTPGSSGAASPSPSSTPPADPRAVRTPADFTVTGIDCGLLDQRADPEVPEPPDGFATADRCVANALRTGQGATFRLISESAEGEPVFARFAVEGPGRLVITEDHRGILASAIDTRVKTCTEARSLSAQGSCTAVDTPRGNEDGTADG